MARIKKIITAQEREQVKQKEADKQKARNDLQNKLSQKAKLSQEDINELVLLLAEEHGFSREGS